MNCAYTLIAVNPPEACPECGVKVQFTNINCYIPDWDDCGSKNSYNDAQKEIH